MYSEILNLRIKINYRVFWKKMSFMVYLYPVYTIPFVYIIHLYYMFIMRRWYSLQKHPVYGFNFKSRAWVCSSADPYMPIITNCHPRDGRLYPHEGVCAAPSGRFYSSDDHNNNNNNATSHNARTNDNRCIISAVSIILWRRIQPGGPCGLYSRLIGRVFFAPVRFMIIEILRTHARHSTDRSHKI